MQRTPTLKGIEGHVKGEEVKLEYGRTIVVGRSRSCDFSLRRIKAWLEKGEEEREKDRSFKTVSGRHFEITMYNLGSIEIVNLSPNGTYVDGKRVDKIVLDDVPEKAHEIKIGTKEALRLELREAEDEDGKDKAGEDEAGKDEVEKDEVEKDDAGKDNQQGSDAAGASEGGSEIL